MYLLGGTGIGNPWLFFLLFWSLSYAIPLQHQAEESDWHSANKQLRRCPALPISRWQDALPPAPAQTSAISRAEAKRVGPARTAARGLGRASFPPDGWSCATKQGHLEMLRNVTLNPCALGEVQQPLHWLLAGSAEDPAQRDRCALGRGSGNRQRSCREHAVTATAGKARNQKGAVFDDSQKRDSSKKREVFARCKRGGC